MPLLHVSASNRLSPTNPEQAKSQTRHRRRVPVLWPWLLVAVAWAVLVLATLTHQTFLLDHHYLLQASGLPWLAALELFLLCWQVMTVAMMLPSSIPMVQLMVYTSRKQGHPVAVPLAFLAGYAVIWTAFAAGAFLGDTGVHRLVVLWPWLALHSWLIGAATFFIAGLFQFSPWKEHCLDMCRTPLGFLLHHYRKGVESAWHLGLRHGGYCLGCCWALMLVMFGVGVGNLAAMAALTGAMVIEKRCQAASVSAQSLGSCSCCSGPCGSHILSGFRGQVYSGWRLLQQEARGRVWGYFDFIFVLFDRDGNWSLRTRRGQPGNIAAWGGNERMTDKLKLMAVLAHPDDESLGNGGILARYAAEGVETYLVTATRGERGWTGSESDYPGSEALGKRREAELLAAAKALGIRRVEFLDYLDGDLDQTPAAEAVAKIVLQLRRVQPDVVVTFGPDGAYGHPDHIAICQFTTAAIVEAASPDAPCHRGLPPHRVSKLYYLVASEHWLHAYQSVFGEVVMHIDGVERRGVVWPEWAITTRIETAEYRQTVWEAILCHESQLAVYRQLEQLSQDYQKELWDRQTYYRAFSLVNGGRQREDDLFAGLR